MDFIGHMIPNMPSNYPPNNITVLSRPSVPRASVRPVTSVRSVRPIRMAFGTGILITGGFHREGTQDTNVNKGCIYHMLFYCGGDFAPPCSSVPSRQSVLIPGS